MRGLLPHYPSGTMNDATPDGAPRGGSETKNSRKTPDSRASERSEEVVHRREYDFYGSCVNQIDSYLFLQSQITPVFKKQIIGLSANALQLNSNHHINTKPLNNKRCEDK
jgi:hypothetical protein